MQNGCQDGLARQDQEVQPRKKVISITSVPIDMTQEISDKRFCLLRSTKVHGKPVDIFTIAFKLFLLGHCLAFLWQFAQIKDLIIEGKVYFCVQSVLLQGDWQEKANSTAMNGTSVHYT